ncbi:MAG TPA: hypothetical protein VGI89_06365 [Rhizomicrobium sp.]|jgi:hypothetical protein
MSDSDYLHSVEIDEEDRLLKIHRVFADGRKQFYTQLNMPPETGAANLSAFEAFSRTLGECLLLDSPAARRVMRL